MRILLVRLRLLGDVALSTPLIRALRHRFPDAHLSYLVEQASAPVVAGNPLLNDVIVARKRAGLARLRDDLAMGRQLRSGRYDVAIDLHGGPRAAWFAWATRAPMRIGYTIAGRSWMYTHLVQRPPDLTPARHSVLNQADLLRPLGIDGCDPLREPMEMASDAMAQQQLQTRLSEAGVRPGDPIVAMHVSTGNGFRRWPALAVTAASLVRRYPDLRVFLVYGPADADAGAVIHEARSAAGAASERILDGDCGIAELRALIARSAVYIGVDSGPVHVAATTETPIVQLLGPTLAERSRPWRDPRWFTEIVETGTLPCRPCKQRQCAPGDFRCLTRITAEQVAAAADRALRHATGRQELGVDRPLMTGSGG
jgi:lipopolysaccharide heptosyltransferase II